MTKGHQDDHHDHHTVVVAVVVFDNRDCSHYLHHFHHTLKWDLVAGVEAEEQQTDTTSP